MDNILIFQRSQPNLTLLVDSLSSNFNVIEGMDEASISKDFDLCMVDTHFFNKFRSLLRLRKISEAPLYLPVILLVRGNAVPQIKPEVWQDVDDIISIPINQHELNARIDVLLRARNQSREIEQLKESQLFELRTRLALTVEAANVGTWDWDLKNKSVSYSREWKLQTGCSENEISDNPNEWKGRIHPDDLPNVLQGLDNLFKLNDSQIELEFRLRHQDGSYRWMMTKAWSVPDATGKVVRIRGVQIDITRRKGIEEELRVSEERFRTIFDFSPDAICLNSLKDLSFLDANKSFFEITGVSKEAVIGKNPLELELFQNPEDLEKILTALANNGGMRNFEADLRMPDGRRLVALVSSSLIDVAGEPNVLTISRDMTEFKRALEERMKLAAAVDQAYEGVVITDVEGAIHYVNPAFIEISGYSREELVGRNTRLLKSGLHDEEFYSKLWQTITNGQVWKGRFINQKKNGSLFHEDATISPLRDHSGKINNFIAIKRDVTETVELSQQLAHSQKMESIGTLAAGIAHDFNNILYAMLGYTEMARDEVAEDSLIAKYLDNVIKSGKRATDMVAQILHFSHRSKAEWGRISISSVVKEGLKLLGSSIPKTIQISRVIAADTHHVIGDSTQIHQILMNLCVNAAHAMKGQTGSITVTLENVDLDEEFTQLNPPLSPGTFVRLTVSDTGHGIPPDVIERMFEPYFTTKPVGEGTGLGLSVVHGIVKNHGGIITVASEPGKGSSLSVFLPATKDEPFEAEEVGETHFHKGSGRILVVDDEQALVEITEGILERHGYNVTSTTSSTEALDTFRADPNRFDLVIADLTMPVLTGLDLAEELSRVRPDMPVILVTGYGFSVDDERKARTEIFSILKKPISSSLLAKAVQQALQKR